MEWIKARVAAARTSSLEMLSSGFDMKMTNCRSAAYNNDIHSQHQTFCVHDSRDRHAQQRRPAPILCGERLSAHVCGECPRPLGAPQTILANRASSLSLAHPGMRSSIGIGVPGHVARRLPFQIRRAHVSGGCPYPLDAPQTIVANRASSISRIT
jgi:hypothetical protein